MGRIKTLRIVMVSGLLLFLTGCSGSGFLETEQITSLTYKEAENNSLIYYKVDYTFSNDGNLRVNTHSILKVGKNTKSLPEIFGVHDG